MDEHAYKPGETVPESGVYRLTHTSHRPPHDATLLKDEQFPPCGVCGDKVRFQLLRSATPIHDDTDFRPPRKSRARRMGQ